MSEADPRHQAAGPIEPHPEVEGPELDRLVHLEVLGRGRNEEIASVSSDPAEARLLEEALPYCAVSGTPGDLTAWAAADLDAADFQPF